MTDNNFELPVTFDGVDYVFNACLIMYGYSYKIDVELFGSVTSFERDEEQRFRAVVPYDMLNETRVADKALLQVVAGRLAELF